MPRRWHHPIIHIMVEDMVSEEDTTIDPGSAYSDVWSGYVIPSTSDKR